MTRFLESVEFSHEQKDEWPFLLPVFRGLGKLTFTSQVTILVGENGSGKSTLMEALAIALKLPAIGRADAHTDLTLKGLHPFSRGMTIHRGIALPKAKFFLRSEDFFGFIQRLEAEAEELRGELERVKRENAHRSAFAQGQAAMAYESSLGAMTGRYGQDMMTAASHGESFLRLFRSRMVPNGLYLLDEPESPLSPLRQLALLKLIDDLNRKDGCQFIIATHSPILMAIPGAVIFSCDESPMAQRRYDELESVTLLKSFLDGPERMIRHMMDE